MKLNASSCGHLQRCKCEVGEVHCSLCIGCLCTWGSCRHASYRNTLNNQGSVSSVNRKHLKTRAFH